MKEPFLKSTMKIWLTRPYLEEDTIALGLSKIGVHVLKSPLISLNLIEKESHLNKIKEIKADSWIILSSPNAIKFFNILMGQNKQLLTDFRIALVGSKSKSMLQSIGLNPCFVSSKPSIDSLCKELPVDKGQDVYYFGSEPDRNAPSLSHIKKRGANVYCTKLYETQAVEIEKEHLISLNKSAPDFIIITSYSAIDSILSQASKFSWSVYEKQIITIGPLTAQYARSQGFKSVLPAEAPSLQGIIKVLRAFA
jgi:uroporphyrinogen-III synthase